MSFGASMCAFFSKIFAGYTLKPVAKSFLWNTVWNGCKKWTKFICMYVFVISFPIFAHNKARFKNMAKKRDDKISSLTTFQNFYIRNCLLCQFMSFCRTFCETYIFFQTIDAMFHCFLPSVLTHTKQRWNETF